MKSAILFTTWVFFTVNLIVGVTFSFYGGYNLLISSGVIITGCVLLMLTADMRLNDGFKVSLLITYSLLTFAEYILAIFGPNRFCNNWCFAVICLLLALEVVLLQISDKISEN